RRQQPIAWPFLSADLIKEFVELGLPVQRLVYVRHGRIGISAIITGSLDGAAENVIAQLWIIARSRIPLAMTPDRIDSMRCPHGEITHIVFDVTIKIRGKEQPRVIVENDPTHDVNRAERRYFSAACGGQPLKRFAQGRRVTRKYLGDGSQSTDFTNSR